MSVLIKGLTMPRKGLSVVVDLWNDGKAYVYGTGNAEMYEAVELPDHGDLIDRDALCIRGGRNCGKMFFAELLKNAPVVIQAERNVKVCPLYSDDEVTEYCVEGPCTDEMEGRCPIAERSADERE